MSLQLAALSTVALTGSVLAADVTLTNNDAGGTSSFAAAGQWNNTAPPSAGNDYFNGGFTLRTTTTASTTTFAGDSLTIDGGAAGRLLGKGAGSGTTQTITVPNLILNGGRLEQAGGENTNNAIFAVNGAINVTAASTLGALGANANGSTNFETMDIGATISGSEVLTVAGSANGGVNRGVVRLSAANPYSGQIDVLQPTNGNTISSTTNRLLQLNHLDALRFATLGLATTAQNPISFAAGVNTGTFRVGAITGSAGQVLTDTAGNPVTLEVGGSGLEGFYSGALRGNGNLVKAGSGTMIIQGQAQTYTGSTTILGGVLSLGTGSLLHNSSTVSIASGAALDLFHEQTDIVKSLTLNGVPQPDGIYDSNTPGGYITGPGKLKVDSTNVTLTTADLLGASSFNSAGGWSNLAAPAPGSNYYTDALTLRTPATEGSFTFEGDSLSIEPGGRFIGKGAGTENSQQTIVVNNLILNGGLMDQAHSAIPGATLNVEGNVTVAASSFVGALSGPVVGGNTVEVLNFIAPISGSVTLHVAGTGNASGNGGVVRLSGANPFTGTVSVEQPARITSLTDRLLQLNHLDALQNATLNLVTTTEDPMSFTAAANTGAFRIGALTGNINQRLEDTTGAAGGDRITSYCDEEKLDVTERLKLFIQVCHAIQHAHQKGIIHRDIKPSNILMATHDGLAQPKVIDFGIAKATENRLPSAAMSTAMDQPVGTPAYMSPEQADMGGIDVDTRSDVYGLGALLYELIAGRPPFDGDALLKSGMSEMRRTLLEKDPLLPSAALLAAEDGGEIAKRRCSEKNRLVSVLAGDLDWIVMKALEKDRNRRYQTANSLAMDVQRYLTDEPVIARRPSRLYLLGKFVRRHRVACISGAAVAISLIGGMSAATVLYLREREALVEQERLRAEAEKARAEESRLRDQAQARANISRVAVLLSEGEIEEADSLLQQNPLASIDPSREAANVYRSLGSWYAVYGRWEQAVQCFALLRQANRLDKRRSIVEGLDLLYTGPAYLEYRDARGYDEFRREVVDLYLPARNTIEAEHLLKVCLLAPATPKMLADLKQVADMCSGVIQPFPDSKNITTFPEWEAFSMALYHYRMGEHEKCLEWSAKSRKIADKVGSRNASLLCLTAMSKRALGKTEEANAELKKAKEMIPAPPDPTDDAARPLPGTWFSWSVARILLREAEGR